MAVSRQPATDGKQMTKRKTQEQARGMFASRGATMVGEYVNAKTPVKCVCDACGATVWPTHDHVQSGNGACKYCAGSAKKTEEEARAIAFDNGYTPDADAPYPGNRTPWKGTCNTCGKSVSPRLNWIRKGGGGCKHCAGNARYTEEEARAIAIAGGYTPDEGASYPGMLKPWKGTCNTCDKTIFPRLSGIQGGSRACKYCAGWAKKTEEEAREIAIDNGFTPDADAPYPGMLKPWKGTCNTCDETVSPNLANIQRQGRGACSGCADYGYDSTKPAHLYLMAGDHDGLPWLKVGITNNAPADRAKDVGGTIIDSVLYENGADAHRDEQEILGQLGDLRGTGIPEGGDGYTESWSAWLMTVTTLTELRERYAVAA
jgi:formylmethanofuran dehydrogenase subunit E